MSGIAPAVIVNQLAAARFEAAQIRIHRIEQSREFRIRVVDVAVETVRRVELERLVVPIRVVEHHELEKWNAEIGMPPLAWRVAGDIAGPASRTGFAAGHQSGIDHLTFGGPETGPDLPHRRHLLAREALRVSEPLQSSVSGLKLQRRGSFNTPSLIPSSASHWLFTASARICTLFAGI